MFCEIGSFYATTGKKNIFINFFLSICNSEKVQVFPDIFRHVKKYLMMFVTGAAFTSMYLLCIIKIMEIKNIYFYTI